MKPITWLGDSREAVRQFSSSARHAAGTELMYVQAGAEPSNWKPMPSIGVGVREIRIRAENAYRVIYVAKFPEAVYVLHAFVKKAQKTSRQDIETAGNRYRELVAARRTK